MLNFILEKNMLFCFPSSSAAIKPINEQSLEAQQRSRNLIGSLRKRKDSNEEI